MSTTRSYIKSDSTTPVTTLPIPPTVTEENAAILNIHMPSDIDNAYYPFPSDYTIHYPFNDNDESYEFVMDQSLLSDRWCHGYKISEVMFYVMKLREHTKERIWLHH